MRSAAQVGGHEWLEAVPSHPFLVCEPVAFRFALRHYLGLDPFGGGVAGQAGGPSIAIPQVCKCQRATRTPVWAHASTCNLGAEAWKRHEGVRACWVDVLELLSARVLVPGEFAPFNDDDRRVDGLIAGVPGLPRETGVDYTVTAVTTASGIDAGHGRDLGAALAAEEGKRRGKVAGRRMEHDMQLAGLGFMPIVHETTGALGPAARDEVLSPLLARLAEDDDARAAARAALKAVGALSSAGELPWNARTVRAFFLKRVGVAVARGVGGAIALHKFRGNQAIAAARMAEQRQVVGRALLRQCSAPVPRGSPVRCPPARRGASVS